MDKSDNKNSSTEIKKNIELEEGIFDLNIEHAKKIQEASLILLEKRGTYLDNKAKNNKNKYKSYKKPALGFGSIRLALKEGYIAVASDFHGDISSLYKFFVQIGYLIPIKNKFLVVYTTYENTEDKEKEFEYIFLDGINKKKLKSLATKVNVIAILPGFEENKYFFSKIKLLGDYIDRGPESLECMLLLDYLTKKEKELLKNNYDKEKLLSVCAGNHELTIIGLRKENPKIKKLIGDMIQDKRIIFGSLEMINNIPVYFSHTSMSKFHIYKILGIIRTFYKISECESIKCTELTEISQINSYGIVEKVAEKFESKEIKVMDHTVLRKIKENFLTLKKHEAYSQLFNKIEKNLTSSYVDKNPEVKKAFDELLEEKKINKEKLKAKSYCRRVLLYFLEKIAESDAKQAYELLSKNVFQDEEYFRLREFIVSVLPSDLYSKLYLHSGLELKHLLIFYDKHKYNKGSGYEGYFYGFINSTGERAFYWPVEERYIATKEMCFSVIQVVGHDASGLAKIEPNEKYMYFLDRLNPYIKNLDDKSGSYFDNKMGSIICVDTLRSVGYQNKNCPYVYKSKNSNIENKSDSALFIITPDLNFIVEKYSVLRDNNFEIIPESTEKEKTFIGLSQSCVDKVKKKNSNLDKEFSSFKRFLSAFSNIKVENKLKAKKVKMISDDKALKFAINPENKPKPEENIKVAEMIVEFEKEKKDKLKKNENKLQAINVNIYLKNKQDENIILAESKSDSDFGFSKSKIDIETSINMQDDNLDNNPREEKEDGEIIDKDKIEKIMSTEETLSYFKEKIGNEIKDKNNQLTSVEIDEILKNFNGKTNYESLCFFVKSCGRHTLSCENFCKLMKYYDDKTENDLLFSIRIALEESERGGKNILDSNTANKIFLNIVEENMCVFALQNIFKRIDRSINIKKYIDNIISHLSKSENVRDLFYFFKKLHNFGFKFELAQENIEQLNSLDLSSHLREESYFSITNAIPFCEHYGKGRLNKKFGEAMISTFYRSFNKAIFSDENFEQLKFQRISRNGNWFDIITKAFKEGEDRDYIAEELIKYGKYVDREIEKLNRRRKYNEAEKDESEKESFRDRSRDKSIDKNKYYPRGEDDNKKHKKYGRDGY